MQHPYETFLSFHDEGQAEIVGKTLDAHGIRFGIVKSRQLLDTNFVGAAFDQNIHVKLDRADFKKAHAALSDYYESQLNDIQPDYFLFSYTNEELQQVIAKPDEWGHLNYQLALRIMAGRGAQIADDRLAELNRQRLRELARPDATDVAFLFIAYCLIPFGFLPSFLIGRHLAFSTRTLPNGDVVYSYRDVDRRHGSRIMLIAGALFFLCLLLYIIAYFKRHS